MGLEQEGTSAQQRAPAEVLADGLLAMFHGTRFAEADVRHALTYFLLPELFGWNAAAVPAPLRRWLAEHAMALGVTRAMDPEDCRRHLEAMFERLPPEPVLLAEVQDLALALVDGERAEQAKRDTSTLGGPAGRAMVSRAGSVMNSALVRQGLEKSLEQPFR